MILTLCHCGHDVATHHPGGVCLGMLCECWGYRDSLKPDVLKPKPQYPIINAIDPDDYGPYTHPAWCTCPVCSKP